MSNSRLRVLALHGTVHLRRSDHSYARQRVSASNCDRIVSTKFQAIATAKKIFRAHEFSFETSEGSFSPSVFVNSRPRRTRKSPLRRTSRGLPETMGTVVRNKISLSAH